MLTGTLGFEIECATKSENESNFNLKSNELKYNFGGDGSIRTTYCPVEIRSPPYKIEKAFLDKVKADLTTLCGYMTEANQSMGFHIHVKLNNFGLHQKLCEHDAVKNFIIAYAKKFTLVAEKNRLSNHYCAFNSISKDSWVNNKKYMDKYLAIDSYAAYDRHNTAEFRIFPSSNDPQKLLSYIKFTLGYLEKMQNQMEKKPEVLEIKRKALVFKKDSNKIEFEVEKELDNQEHGAVHCPMCGKVF